jgi:hypothetical protein
MLKLGLKPETIAVAFGLPLETVNDYSKTINEGQA